MKRSRLRLCQLEDRLAPTAGLLDPTFGVGGLATTRFPEVSNDYGRAAAIDHAGRVVVAGYTYNNEDYDFAIARYSATGALDTSFGGGTGVSTIDLGIGNSNDLALDVAVDSMNRVLVAGYASNGSNYDFAVVRLTAAGTLDSSFGSGGKQLIDFAGSTDQAASVAVDSLDRVVVAGYTNIPFSGNDFAVARLTAAGALDSSFGAGGKVTIDFAGSNDVAYCVAIDSLGRAVVSGSARIGTNSDFAVARLTSAGALDSSFGTGGKVSIDFAAGDDVAAGIAVDSLGRVVLGGWARMGANNVFAAARLTNTGGLDSSFGAGGKFTFAFGASNDQAWSVAVDSLDRVVLAGYSSNGSDDDFAVARITTAGALDSNFDFDGKQTIAFGTSTDEAYGVAVDSLNRVVVSGYAFNPSADFAVARLTTAGALDASFDGDGKQTTELRAASDARGSAVAVDHLGRTVVAGSGFGASSRDFIITRFTAAGVLDTSFGSSGVAYVDMTGGDDYAYGMAIDSMNRVIVVGSVLGDFGVARLTATGALDAGFGVGGKLAIDFAGSDDVAEAVAVDSSDRPVIAGITGIGSSNDDFAVARLTTSGALDTSFDGDGKQTLGFGTSNDDAGAVAVDSLGRVVVAGSAWVNANYDFAVARLTANGALDSSFAVGGKTTFPMGVDADYAGAVAVDSQNRVVVAGQRDTGSAWNFAVARLTAAGALDSSFNGNGRQFVSFGFTDDRANAVAVDAHDRVVVAGSSVNGTSDFGIARLTVDGALDATFGAGGKTTVVFGPSIDVPYGVAIDGAGRAVVAGWANVHGDVFAVARLTGDTTTASAQVNDGSAQRSRVTSLTVRFSSQVTFAGSPDQAFTLVRTGGGAVSFTATVSVQNGGTVVTLDHFIGAETEFGSLRDGRYTLTALTSQISSGGVALDGNGDGQAGGDFDFGDAQGLFRLFGDVNGDQTVNGLDFGFFKNAFGTQLGDSNYLSYLDIDGDGVINGFEFGQFRTRFGTMLP